MDSLKPWYLSRTVWASLVAITASLAGLLGFPIEDGETDALVDGLVQAVVALASLFALFGRLVARARIG